MLGIRIYLHVKVWWSYACFLFAFIVLYIISITIHHIFTHSFLNIRRGSSSLLHCCRISGRNHREGMGLLEHQTVSSLRDLAHDGLLSYIYQQLEFPSAFSWAASIRAIGTERKSTAVRPVHHVQTHTCRVTLLQPARRAAVLDQPYI
jgi:hypothetical protein